MKKDTDNFMLFAFCLFILIVVATSGCKSTTPTESKDPKIPATPERLK